MRRAALLLMISIWSVSPCVGEEPPSADSSVGEVSSTIQYLSGAIVYVSSGLAQGLQEGDLMDVVRDGRVVGRLKVRFLSTGTSSCEIVSREVELRAGDLVRHFHVELASEPPAVAAEPQGRQVQRRSKGWLRDNGIRGRVGMRLLMLDDGGPVPRRVAQPGLDARLDGQDVGGSPIDLAIDVRARRTYKNGSRTDTGRGTTRVYRLAGSWQSPGSAFRMTAGRQSSAPLATVGTFDGALLQRLGARWSFGAFGGSQPDPISYGTSSEILESGIYCERANEKGAERRYAVTAGMIGSYRRGIVNREFLYLQQRYDTDALGLTLAEELDLNRSWKADAGERPLSFTSFYAQSRLRLHRGLDLRAGFDNRRNVRFYRDHVTPETEFDDDYRQGASAGMTLRLGNHVDVGADARSSRAGGSLENDSYTAGLGVAQITRLALGARTRSTRYRSGRLDGWLHSLYFVSSPLEFLYLELRGGFREEQVKAPSSGGRMIRWFGGDADLSASRRLYFVLSAERTLEDGQRSDQVYLRASLRY